MTLQPSGLENAIRSCTSTGGIPWREKAGAPSGRSKVEVRAGRPKKTDLDCIDMTTAKCSGSATIRDETSTS